MAIASLVLGIIAVVFCLMGPLAWLGLIVGVVGLVLAILARKTEKTGASTAGMVLSIIGIVLSGIMWLACMVCASGAKQAIESDELKKGFEKLQTELQKDPEFQKGMEELNKALEEIK